MNSDLLHYSPRHVIITSAKARCYIMEAPKPTRENEDEWDILDEVENTANRTKPGEPERRSWMPENMKPVLEEPGKWSVLADVLLEIEHEIINRPPRLSKRSNDSVPYLF